MVQAVETVLGPGGMTRLLQGDLDQPPGETFAAHASGGPGRHRGLGPGGRRLAQKRAIVIERARDRGHDKGDVWEL